jgi:hypothetical protein
MGKMSYPLILRGIALDELDTHLSLAGQLPGSYFLSPSSKKLFVLGV